jgi:hypothetical protein
MQHFDARTREGTLLGLGLFEEIAEVIASTFLAVDVFEVDMASDDSNLILRLSLGLRA